MFYESGITRQGLECPFQWVRATQYANINKEISERNMKEMKGKSMTVKARNFRTEVKKVLSGKAPTK